jgi:hypothetical protein
MRRRSVVLVAGLVFVALSAFGVTRGLGASPQAPSPAPVEEEPPVPAAGARVTASQVQEVRAIALEDAAEAGEDAPTMVIAGKTQTLAQGQAMSSAAPNSATPSQAIDPRTDEPESQSSVYVVAMVGHFTETRHIPDNQLPPTGTQLRLTIDVASGKVVTTSLSNYPRTLPEPIDPAAAEESANS